MKIFRYLGARIEANGKTIQEIRRRFAIGKAKLKMMNSIWKGQSKDTKVTVLRYVNFPIAMYRCEAWIISRQDTKRITAFNIKCYRRILEYHGKRK